MLGMSRHDSPPNLSRKDIIMARSSHAQYTAADRFERRASRKPRPSVRRLGTRSAVVRLALREV